MKKTEKILVAIWIAFLLLKGIDYTGGTAFFVLATLVLSLFYLIGSFKLFDPGGNSPLAIPILAGLSFATSIITLPFNIYLRNWDWLQIFPFVNIVFTTIILGLLIIKWIRKKPIESYLKRILFRSLIILFITSLFAFRPAKSQLYRNTIIFLNAGKDDMISNMKMIDYWEESEDLLERGNCDKAIEYSLLSFHEGLKWLRIDSDSLTERDIRQLWQIHGTYTNIYKAYECKAEKLYQSKDYQEALYYQFKADSFLNINPKALNDSWKADRANSKNDIGIYYRALGEYDSAVSYYSKAIVYHMDSIKTLNSKLATYLSNLSSSLAKSHHWLESTQAAEKSISILKKDTLAVDRDEKFTITYLQLVYNSLSQNQPLKASQYLEAVKPYLTPEWECKYFLYHAILANKLDMSSETLYFAGEAMSCYRGFFGELTQNIAESHSLAFEAWMKIPNYDSALAHIQKGMSITRHNHGSTSVRYHDYVKREGDYYYSIGDYTNSLSRLNDVRKVFERELGPEENKLPEILATIGRIKIELGEYREAEKLANESLRIAKIHQFFIDERATGLLNDIAYIKYVVNEKTVSDTLYQKSIELNKKVKNDSSLSVASALNGLGLLAMKKSQFDQAESLFTESLQLYRNRYSDLHPNIGIVLMNRSDLYRIKREFGKALTHIDDAIKNYSPFHRIDHPIIGDMYALKASILLDMGERTKPNELLEKALEIYESNFRPQHAKITNTKNKLEQSHNR